GPRRDQLRGGGGRYEQREDEQRAGDLARLGDRQAEDEQERGAEQPHRDAARYGHVGVDRREDQRPSSERDQRERRRRHDEQHLDLAARDPEDVSEEQR